MTNNEKILLEILLFKNDRNIRFNDLCGVLDHLGFKNRIKGDHFIYFKDGIDEIINIQPDKNMAKPYQIKQVRNILLKYKLIGGKYE